MKPEERIPGLRVYWQGVSDYTGTIADPVPDDDWSVWVKWDDPNEPAPARQTAKLVTLDYDDFDTWVIMTRAKNHKS